MKASIIPQKLVEHDVSDSDKLSEIDTEVIFENIDTPFVTKRRGIPSKRGSGDRSVHRKDKTRELSPFQLNIIIFLR